MVASLVVRAWASLLANPVEVTLLRYIFVSPSPRFGRGTPGASGNAPKSAAVSRSALLGGPNGIPGSETRPDPQGGIQVGGANKAERRRAQGAVRPRGRQAQRCPTVTAARRTMLYRSDRAVP